MQRSDRIAEEIRKLIGKALTTEIADPKLPPFSSVTEVLVNHDLSVAKIYVSNLNGRTAADDLLAVLNRAMPYLRRQVAQRLALRNAPELRFYYDDSEERGRAMDLLIDQVRADDAKRAALQPQGEDSSVESGEEA